MTRNVSPGVASPNPRLGLPHDLRPDRRRVSLDFLASRRARGFFVPKGLTAGPRFEATDLDWTSGGRSRGPGTAEAVMLALTGRSVVLAELDGEGVAALRDRLARRAANRTG